MASASAWRAPPAARCSSVVARVAASAVAEELLAVYFLECRKDLLVEWLDSLAIPHEDGSLSEEAPDAPTQAKLAKAVKDFLAADDAADRGLLLAAFAAQSSIDWPDLEALIGGGP